MPRLSKSVAGKQYWIYNGYEFIENTPLPLSYLGLPEDVKKLDTAFVWGKNEKTYFFRENLYWRFDEYSRRIEDGYPFEIGHRWHGVPNNLQSVFTDTSGNISVFCWRCAQKCKNISFCRCDVFLQRQYLLLIWWLHGQSGEAQLKYNLQILVQLSLVNLEIKLLFKTPSLSSKPS